MVDNVTLQDIRNMMMVTLAEATVDRRDANISSNVFADYIRQIDELPRPVDTTLELRQRLAAAETELVRQTEWKMTLIEALTATLRSSCDALARATEKLK